MTLRLGDGSLVVTDTQCYSDEPSTAYLQDAQRGKIFLWTAAAILVFGHVSLRWASQILIAI